ncbi:hypothetical protein NE237_033218 [Protea cynaroides]|uniref:Uncharacterized protein n=1 Tax=Protea cynaroides TaxID=273540 RepID=A0A9Q0L5Q9_9MAGN|nr:hypothetical protein NE237_033218 [Protea cynaroides]
MYWQAARPNSGPWICGRNLLPQETIWIPLVKVEEGSSLRDLQRPPLSPPAGSMVCGLCSEAVRDEANRGKNPFGVDEAVKAHMCFCRKFKSNAVVRVADGMRQMLRRRSRDCSSRSSFSSSSSSSKKYMRSANTSQVGDESSFSLN